MSGAFWLTEGSIFENERSIFDHFSLSGERFTEKRNKNNKTKGKITMAVINYVVSVSDNALTGEKVKRPIAQHVRSMTEDESVAKIAEETGYKEATVRAALLSFAKIVKRYVKRGNTTKLDGVASFPISCKGSFASLNGPWVTGSNYLEVGVTELDPWKSALAGMTAKNISESISPTIDTVLDTVTGQYDIITGTDEISVGGNNLAPDTTQSAQKMVFVGVESGTEYACTITSSDLGLVKGHLNISAPAGQYYLRLYTSCGIEDGEVKVASRLVTIQ